MDLMEIYINRLLRANETLNLTAIRDPREAALRHIDDSLALLDVADLRGKSVIDVGSGGGLPGIPLRLREPSIRLTLLDATAKKVSFLREVCKELSLDNVDCVAARAEEQALKPGWRDSFDIAAARGVAYLPVLAELCLPLVKPGGVFLAMKGADCAAEAEAACAHIGTLGGAGPEIRAYELAPGLTHAVVIVRKIKPTPEGYPRRYAKIVQAFSPKAASL